VCPANLAQVSELRAGEKRANARYVGVNHRLNGFGYLYLGEIGGEKYTDSGNVGMVDIVLALQWVRDNNSRFGGPGLRFRLASCCMSFAIDSEAQ
jgi:carboxylesterase type B